MEYYQNNFGMKLIHKKDFEEAKFSLYFLAFDSPGAESAGRHLTDREGILELTHNCSTLFGSFLNNNNNNCGWGLADWGWLVVG